MPTDEQQLVEAGKALGIPEERIRRELRRRPVVPQHLKDSLVMAGTGGVLTMDEVQAMCRRNREKNKSPCC